MGKVQMNIDRWMRRLISLRRWMLAWGKGRLRKGRNIWARFKNSHFEGNTC
jgi:hypothetical protein